MTDAPLSASGAPTTEVALDLCGTTIPFTVADDGSGRGFFTMGIRKSGSTLLAKVAIFLARRNAVNTIDVPGSCFQRGLQVRDWADADMSPILRGGNHYTGFRAFPGAMADTDLFRRSPKVFMFRDPRDALVSQYFSDAYSHSLPKEGPGRAAFLRKREETLATEIDDYVLDKAQGMRGTMAGYFGMLDDPTCRLLRYESYVFQKRRMVHKILQAYGWTCDPDQVDALLARVDEVPDAEEKTRFVRKAVPGDHAVKLRRETIRRLNDVLADVMERYDYH